MAKAGEGFADVGRQVEAKLTFIIPSTTGRDQLWEGMGVCQEVGK